MTAVNLSLDFSTRGGLNHPHPPVLSSGFAASTSPAVLAETSLPSRGVGGLTPELLFAPELLFDIVWPLFVVVGFEASPPPLTVNATI